MRYWGFILTLLFCSMDTSAHAQWPGCLETGGYPWAQGSCNNPSDLNSAIDWSVNRSPPGNVLGAGAALGHRWLDLTQTPAMLRLCLGNSPLTPGHCSSQFVASEWKNLYPVDLTSNTPASLANIGTIASQNSNALNVTGVIKLTGLPNCVNGSDACPKSYIDGLASGLTTHQPVAAVTTVPPGPLPFGPNYANGTAGVGATLTATVAGVLVIDSYTPLLNDRLIINNQTSAIQNGVYTITRLGTVSVAYQLTRSVDTNAAGTGPNFLQNGAAFLAQQGGHSGVNWVLSVPPGPITIGTTALTFFQFLGEPNPFGGDSGAGGTPGLVPAPVAGQGSLGYVLGAAGNWFAPSLNMVMNWFGGSLGVANNAALAAFPSSAAGRIVNRMGFANAGDSPALNYQSKSGTCAFNSKVNDGAVCVNANDGGSWVALVPPGGLDIREWGALGDCSTNNAGAFATALASNIPIRIPQGDFLIASPVVYSGTEGSIQGEGWNEQGLSQSPNPLTGCTTAPGSYITIVNTGAFTFTTPTGSSGPKFRHLAFLERQPNPGPGWTPTAYSPVITLDGSAAPITGALFEDIGLGAIYDFVYGKGNAARIQIDTLYGQVFNHIFLGEDAQDTSKASNWHIWPFWSVNTNVLNWQNVNANAIVLKRQDSFQADNLFIFGAHSCLQLSQWTGAGVPGPPTGIHIGNLNCDSAKYPIWVDSTSLNSSVSVDHFWVGGEDINGLPIVGGNAIQIDGQNANINLGDVHIIAVEGSVINDTNTSLGSQVRLASIIGDPIVGWNYTSGGGYYTGNHPAINDASPANAASEFSILHPVQPQNAGASFATPISSGIINTNSNAQLLMATEDQAWFSSAVSNTQSVSWPRWASTLILNPIAGSIASTTLVLPNLLDGTKLKLICNGTITSITLTAPAGFVVVPATRTCPAAGAQVSFNFTGYVGIPTWWATQ